MAQYGQAADWQLYFGMVVGQALLWAWLYNLKGPLRGKIHEWIDRDKTREENLLLNGNDSAANWSFWIIVALHHGLGGGLAAIGALLGDDFIWLFRLGLSFEIGEDFLHYVMMAMTGICGIQTEMFSDLWPGKTMWFGIACHHAVGSVGGSFVFIFIPGTQTAQLCVVLLLLGAVPQLLQYPFMPFENLKGDTVSCVGRIAAVLTILGTALAFVARMFLFPPAAIRLSEDMKPIYGETTANVLLSSAGLFMIFAVASLWLSLKEVWAALKQLFAVARAEGPRAALQKLGEQRGSFLAATEASFMLATRTEKSAREADLMMAERRSAEPKAQA